MANNIKRPITTYEELPFLNKLNVSIPISVADNLDGVVLPDKEVAAIRKSLDDN